MTTTAAPRRASRSAWARPMPRPAPVTIATRPSKLCSSTPGPFSRSRCTDQSLYFWASASTRGALVVRRPLFGLRSHRCHHAEPARGAQRGQPRDGARPRGCRRPTGGRRRRLGRAPLRRHRGPGSARLLCGRRPQGHPGDGFRGDARHRAGRVRRVRLPRAHEADRRRRRRARDRGRARDRPRGRRRRGDDPICVRARRGPAQPDRCGRRAVPASARDRSGGGDGRDPDGRADRRSARVRPRAREPPGRTRYGARRSSACRAADRRGRSTRGASEPACGPRGRDRTRGCAPTGLAATGWTSCSNPRTRRKGCSRSRRSAPRDGKAADERAPRGTVNPDAAHCTQR